VPFGVWRRLELTDPTPVNSTEVFDFFPVFQDRGKLFMIAAIRCLKSLELGHVGSFKLHTATHGPLTLPGWSCSCRPLRFGRIVVTFCEFRMFLDVSTACLVGFKVVINVLYLNLLGPGTFPSLDISGYLDNIYIYVHIYIHMFHMMIISMLIHCSIFFVGKTMKPKVASQPFGAQPCNLEG